MVLLKNEDLLPFNPKKIKKLAVIGPNAKDSQIIGGGSAGLKPHYSIHPLEGIVNLATLRSLSIFSSIVFSFT